MGTKKRSRYIKKNRSYKGGVKRPLPIELGKVSALGEALKDATYLKRKRLQKAGGLLLGLITVTSGPGLAIGASIGSFGAIAYAIRLYKQKSSIGSTNYQSIIKIYYEVVYRMIEVIKTSTTEVNVQEFLQANSIDLKNDYTINEVDTPKIVKLLDRKIKYNNKIKTIFEILLETLPTYFANGQRGYFKINLQDEFRELDNKLYDEGNVETSITNKTNLNQYQANLITAKADVIAFKTKYEELLKIIPEEDELNTYKYLAPLQKVDIDTSIGKIIAEFEKIKNLKTVLTSSLFDLNNNTNLIAIADTNMNDLEKIIKEDYTAVGGGHIYKALEKGTNNIWDGVTKHGPAVAKGVLHSPKNIVSAVDYTLGKGLEGTGNALISTGTIAASKAKNAYVALKDKATFDAVKTGAEATFGAVKTGAADKSKAVSEEITKGLDAVTGLQYKAPVATKVIKDYKTNLDSINNEINTITTKLKNNENIVNGSIVKILE